MKHRRLSLNFVELVKIESPQNIHEEFHSCGNNSFFSLPGRQKTLKSWDEASLKLTCSFTVHEYHLSPPHTPRMHSPNAVVCCWFKKKKKNLSCLFIYLIEWYFINDSLGKYGYSTLFSLSQQYEVHNMVKEDLLLIFHSFVGFRYKHCSSIFC